MLGIDNFMLKYKSVTFPGVFIFLNFLFHKVSHQNDRRTIEIKHFHVEWSGKVCYPLVPICSGRTEKTAVECARG